MKMCPINKEEYEELRNNLILKDRQERIAEASLTSEMLSQLNISIDNLPQKCQQLLNQTADNQTSVGINELDPISISLQQSRDISNNLEDEYEILKLKQKDKELQAKIDRNSKVIEGLKRELECSRESLASQNPGPDSVQEHIRELKQKVVSYEDGCEKAKTKYAKLCVPDAILPKSLQSLVTSLCSLQEEAAALKLRSDDATLARDARQALASLRR